MLEEIVHNNLRSVDPEALERQYSSLFPREGIMGFYVSAEGRSLYGTEIGFNELLGYEKVLLTGCDANYGFGSDIRTAIKNMRRFCDDVQVIISSASGMSKTPWIDAKRAKGRATINVLTETPESEIGKLADHLVKLKGRWSRDAKNEEYLNEGIMGDPFELGAACYWYTVAKGIKNGVNLEEFADFYLEETEALFSRLKSELKRIERDSRYKYVVELIRDPERTIFLCDDGSCVAKFTNIRLRNARASLLTAAREYEQNHKLNDNYVIGETSVPKIDKQSLLLVITKEPEESLKYQIGVAKKNGAEVVCIASNPVDTDVECIELPECDFNITAAFLTTKMCIEMCRKLPQSIEIDEETFRAFHLEDKIKV